MEDEFTNEELVELGELDESELGQEDQEDDTGQTGEGGEADDSEKADDLDGEVADEDEQAEDEQPVEDEDLEPDLTDYDKLSSRAEAAEQKLELLRKDPNEYYKQYPDERPHDETPPQTEQQEKATEDDVMSLTVQGGQYAGLTLAEVQEKNPVMATKLYLDFREREAAEIKEKEELQQKVQNEINTEIDEFADFLASDSFGKKSGKELTKEELAQTDSVMSEVHKYIMDNPRVSALHIKDVYFLMNRDKDITKARKDGFKSLKETLSKPSVKSVSGSKSGSVKSGYDVYLGMSADELATEIENMSDSALTKFMSSAPKELRDKYPSMDWD
jgi:hypothetical protein